MRRRRRRRRRKTTTPCHRVTMTVGLKMSVGSELSLQPPTPGASGRSKTTCLIGDLVEFCLPFREVSELRNRQLKMEKACIPGIAPGRAIGGITGAREGNL
ncbi:unnamed protein product [Prorocentrum cordatum]|uniref:Uncharacterized protein n=2 Tax=Prorocentrum cordatum TaxID=2364126 RepID=A0ABN9VFZ4_9DINO|nr:unnamed protein product [Polarella glacialis]